MKFLNQLICVISLFAVASVSARKTGTRVSSDATRPESMPTQVPRATYKQLHDNILKLTQAQVFSGTTLSDAFINNTTLQAKSADIGKKGLEALLQTARDKFAPFTTNDADNLGILQAINQQIETAVEKI